MFMSKVSIPKGMESYIHYFTVQIQINDDDCAKVWFDAGCQVTSDIG